MADPKQPNDTEEKKSSGVFDNALRRTDNAYNGKKPDESLIGHDIPPEEQDEEEEDEWK